jgi:hypothetical protein
LNIEISSECIYLNKENVSKNNRKKADHDGVEKYTSSRINHSTLEIKGKWKGYNFWIYITSELSI